MQTFFKKNFLYFVWRFNNSIIIIIIIGTVISYIKVYRINSFNMCDPGTQNQG